MGAGSLHPLVYMWDINSLWTALVCPWKISHHLRSWCCLTACMKSLKKLNWSQLDVVVLVVKMAHMWDHVAWRARSSLFSPTNWSFLNFSFPPSEDPLLKRCNLLLKLSCSAFDERWASSTPSTSTYFNYQVRSRSSSKGNRYNRFILSCRTSIGH